MANVDIKIFENISLKERVVFDVFIKNNWGEDINKNDEERNLKMFDIPRLWVVGYKNEKVVGLFLIYDKNISFEGRIVKLAGVGGVVTRVDYRRQGVMSQILQKFFSQNVARYKFDMAMLCTDIKKIGKLYGRVGFVPLNRPYFYNDRNGVEKEVLGGMIIGLQNKSIVNKILTSKSKLSVGDSNF